VVVTSEERRNCCVHGPLIAALIKDFINLADKFLKQLNVQISAKFKHSFVVNNQLSQTFVMGIYLFI
jgi:hypothetical protein